MTSLEELEHPFKIILKFVSCGFYVKQNVAFKLISFLKYWNEMIVQLPFLLPFEVSFHLHIDLELNLLEQNANELEIELPSRIVTSSNVRY